MLMNFSIRENIQIENLNITGFGKQVLPARELDNTDKARATLLKFWFTRLAGSYHGKVTSQAIEGKEYNIKLKSIGELKSVEIDKVLAAGLLAEEIDSYQDHGTFSKYPMLKGKTRYIEFKKSEGKELIFIAAEFILNFSTWVTFTYDKQKYRVFYENLSVLNALKYAKLMSRWLNSRHPLDEFTNLAIDNENGELALGFEAYVVKPGSIGGNTYAVSSTDSETKDLVTFEKKSNGWEYNHSYTHERNGIKEWREASYTIVPWLETSKRTHLTFTTEFIETENEDLEEKSERNKLTSISFSDSFRKELIPQLTYIYIPGFETGELYANKIFKKFELKSFIPVCEIFSDFLLKVNKKVLHYPLGLMEKVIFIELLTGCRIDSFQDFWLGRKIIFKHVLHTYNIEKTEKDEKRKTLHIQSFHNLCESKNLRFILPVLGKLALQEGCEKSDYFYLVKNTHLQLPNLRTRDYPIPDSDFKERDYFDRFKSASYDLDNKIPTNVVVEMVKSIGPSSYFNRIDWFNRGMLYNKNCMASLLFDNFLLLDNSLFKAVELLNLNLI
jgi:hypothetical protein